MLLAPAIFIALATSFAIISPRQTDQDIPADEPYCRCDEGMGPSDETLTQAVCKEYGGKFRIYRTADGSKLQGACFSYDFDGAATAMIPFAQSCYKQSGGQCQYYARCADAYDVEEVPVCSV